MNWYLFELKRNPSIVIIDLWQRNLTKCGREKQAFLTNTPQATSLSLPHLLDWGILSIWGEFWEDSPVQQSLKNYLI